MGQKIRQHLTTDVPCPTCGSKPGDACTTPMRADEFEPGKHKGRREAVRWLHHARKPVDA